MYTRVVFWGSRGGFEGEKVEKDECINLWREFRKKKGLRTRTRKGGGDTYTLVEIPTL